LVNGLSPIGYPALPKMMHTRNNSNCGQFVAGRHDLDLTATSLPKLKGLLRVRPNEQKKRGEPVAKPNSRFADQTLESVSIGGVIGAV
jgi:hypothetical protein